MHHVAAEVNLQLLTDKKKTQLTPFYEEMLHQAEDKENFLKNILIWSQTWVYRYNKTKRQSL
jgi:hypothetical protein